MIVPRLLALLVVTSLIASPRSSLAENVTLAWNPSTDPRVTSYNLYYGGGSGDYTNKLGAGTNTLLTVTNLAVGETYFFAATTVDASGLESTFSGEVGYQVPKHQGSISLANLNQTYDGTPKAPTVLTTPPGLLVTLTYNGQLTPPSAAGSYQVIALVVDLFYIGSVTNILVIPKAQAAVQLSNLTQVYDGSPEAASATTMPSGLAVVLTYNDQTNAPTNPGVYNLVANVVNPNYWGSATNTFLINIFNPPSLLLSWPLVTNEVTISQSTDLNTWTILTTIPGPSSSFPVLGQPVPHFFTATQAGSTGTNKPLPLAIGFPPPP